MGLIEQEVTELRSLLRQYRDGKVSEDRLRGEISVFSEIEKRERLMLKAFAMTITGGRVVTKKLEAANIVGNGTAIDLSTNLERETIRCPALGTVINRAGCLDYSGDPAHLDECERCDRFEETRRLLLPKSDG